MAIFFFTLFFLVSVINLQFYNQKVGGEDTLKQKNEMPKRP